MTISSVRGAIIYNTTTDGGAGTTDALMILDFGRDLAATAENFTVNMPTADALNAIVRFQ